MNNKIIAIVGPTASGKTALSVQIAKEFSGQIISCDSMQIYKGMDIGTAKVTKDEMENVPHHLIDFVSSNSAYSVSDYVEDAQKAIEKIQNQGDLAIFAGGTGLYLRSVLYGVNFTENSKDDEIRLNLEKQIENGEVESLYQKLNELDPTATENIHINNHKRLVRALEYCLVTGKLFSQQSVITNEKYPHILICLGYRDREKLYQRINQRVDIMMQNGLLEEAKIYLNENLNTANQAIGYKELKPYLNGEITLDEAVENIKRETRRYAKRQLTWFKAQKNTNWIYVDDFNSQEEIIHEVKKIVKRFLEDGVKNEIR